MSRTTPHPRPLAGLFAALSLVFAAATAPLPAVAADPAATALPAWDSSLDLYRDGVFTTQKSWLWCTAAGVQIVRNIVDEQEDHSVSAQRRYFNWMREHNRYTLPLSAGVDPQGWTAGLRHYVDDRYRLVTSTTFDDALRSAVKRLRLTNLPVALTVAHGNHGWILTGFAATADPSVTASFKVTSVRIVGPLYGLQSKNGYDMPPDTKLTPTQLKRYFTPWKYPPKAMIWDGRYVSIQPVPASTTTGTTAVAPPPSTTSAGDSTEQGHAGAGSAAQPLPSAVRDGSRPASVDPFAQSTGAQTSQPLSDGGRDFAVVGIIAAAGVLATALVIAITFLITRLMAHSTDAVRRQSRRAWVPGPG